MSLRHVLSVTALALACAGVHAQPSSAVERERHGNRVSENLPEIPAELLERLNRYQNTRGAGLDVEGLGIVFLEASASGVPVVAGNSGGAPETVIEGKTGRVVDGRKTDTIVKAIVGILADRDAAARMGAEGRAWVEQQWRWDSMGDRLKHLLH